MNFEARRQKLFEQMEEESLLILHSGIPSHISADDYYPFEANRHFFYLTGLRREKMTLVMWKLNGASHTTLYIEEADPAAERWTGKMVTVPEAKEITGIEDVRYLPRFDREIHYLMTSANVKTCYFDCYRLQKEDMADYNLLQAQTMQNDYPNVQVRSLWPMVTKLRMEKDEQEIAKISEAVEVTNQSLRYVMKRVKPGMKEYQVQADFEYMVHYLGADGVSFQTIAGSGKNGTMLHYETNRDTCQDGTLVLLDLGARMDGYCADITRTYPVNGKFTDRQRKVYDVVLNANRTVAETAKPGMTLRELNDVCKKVLAEGCMELGLIQNEAEVGKYYMHGVSHHLGIDVHDVTLGNSKLTPGCVITNEPGLYIDEWEIGIRIEDDLLITEDGCKVLSENILRDPDEIEAFMADR